MSLFFLLVFSVLLSHPIQGRAESIGRVERAKLYLKFKRKALTEERHFELEEKGRHKDLVRMQYERRKRWREDERKARRAFFDSHMSGPERRAYVQDFVKRRKELDQTEKREWVEFRKKERMDRDGFRAAQKEKEKQFQTALEQNRKPDL